MIKVGIITYHGAYNYGAYLQACALCSRLNCIDDVEAEIINFRMRKELEYYSVNNWSLKRKIRHMQSYMFTKRLYKAFSKSKYDIGRASLAKEIVVSDNLEDFSLLVKGKYDLIIAGSDEIWNISSFRGFPTPYWLIGDLGARKMSYAASSRVDLNRLDSFTVQYMTKILSEFEYIGVRDQKTFSEISRLVDETKEIQMCCDPSFLYKFDVSNEILPIFSECKKYNACKKNILVMTESDIIASQILKKYGSRYNLISVYHYHRGFINVPDLSPEEWLQAINSVDLVLASYFHAICFSIMCKTKFIALATSSKKSKLEALLFNSCLEQFYDKCDNSTVTIDVDKIIEETLDEDKYNEFVNFQLRNFDSFVKVIKKDEQLYKN